MKLLFISNISGKHENNFSLSSAHAAQSNGFEFYRAANLDNKPQEVRKEEEQKYNIKLRHLDIKRNPFHPGNIKAFIQTMKLIKKENFDAIHCNTPIGGILGRMCGKISGVPKIIYTAHGFHFYKGAPLFNRTVLKWIEQLMAHWTDAIITMNDEDYKAALKFKLRNKGKVYKIHGVGIDTKQYQDISVNNRELRLSLGLSEDDIICISMGDLVKNKNYVTAIRAVAQCKNEKLHYIICGKGPEKENLHKLIKEHGAEKRIHLLGFRSDIKELLKISDIFLFTTLREGLSRSMMEAMASGLPCIASKIRGNIDLIEDGKGGFLVEPNNANGFTEALIKLTENNALCKKMSSVNLENIKEFDVENVKKEMFEIYKDVLC